jgi:crotonobetainyl-CoA:carnitine CoA-transferase CaiB-like acyl-CoA transferase
MPVGAFGDTLSGLALAGGVAAALAAKARTGRGSVVHGSLFATSLWAMAPGIAASAIAGGDVTGRTEERTLGRNPLSATYRTADDRFVVLGMLQPDKYWAGFCDAIERPDLAGDERFITAEQRAAHCDECVAILDDVFGAHPLAVWRRRLLRQEGQWDVVQRLSELATDRQALANRYIQVGVDGANGALPVVPAPVRHGGVSVDVRAAPRRGEHTQSVLESLPLSAPLLARAHAEGAVPPDDEPG